MNDSESTCEVVEVVEISKHPNANKLSIVKFKFANGIIPDYQCIAGNGDFVVGGLAVYISDDMMVPTNREEFAFLKNRLDFKADKYGGMYRIKAAKIRGEISTGLLIPTKDISGSRDTVAVGEDMSGKLGVVKYESPLERREAAGFSGNSNLRIGWLRRTLLRLTRWFYTPVQIPEYGVLSLRKVPGLFTEGEQVVYTEKIHGSNIRFGLVNGRIYIGSHHTEKSDSRPWLLRKIAPKNRGAGYYGKDAWTGWFNRIFNNPERLKQLPNNIIFYGELFGPGIQPWTYSLANTQVMVFDAYDLKTKKWLNRHDVNCLLPGFIQTVPTIQWSVPFSKDTLKQLAEGNSSIPSCFYTGLKNDIPREGIVVRSMDFSKAGKLVSDRYLASEH